MRRRVLDIDNSESWAPIYEPFFESLAAPEVWDQLFDPEKFASAPTRVDALARLAAPPRQWKSRWLRRQAREFLCVSFTHFACYHACRIVDVESYRSRGLLPADLDVLDAQAVELFGESAALTQAIAAARRGGYRAHNHGGVFFFFARSGAVHVGDHYLSHGSEYLARIAGDLGSKHLELLEQRGQPAVVRCELTLAELGRHADFAAMLPVHQKLMVRDPIAPPRIFAVEGGFRYDCALGPDRISIEFVDLAAI